jgi:hypothetical protein
LFTVHGLDHVAQKKDVLIFCLNKKIMIKKIFIGSSEGHEDVREVNGVRVIKESWQNNVKNE